MSQARPGDGEDVICTIPIIYTCFECQARSQGGFEGVQQQYRVQSFNRAVVLQWSK